jgi:uncharacterized protein YxjI
MYNYPLTLSFKLLALNPQVNVADASGQTVLYVKEKAFSLKVNINVFADEGQQQQLYHIQADKALGMNINYSITTPMGAPVAQVQRPTMASMWKATYQISDGAGKPLGTVREESPWLKVLDSVLSDVPFIYMFINPGYLVDLRGQPALYLKKQPSMMDRTFKLEKRAELSDADERLLLPAVLLAMMMERMRR